MSLERRLEWSDFRVVNYTRRILFFNFGFERNTFSNILHGRLFYNHAFIQCPLP